jgi:lipase chaperone LimK
MVVVVAPLSALLELVIIVKSEDLLDYFLEAICRVQGG